MRCGGEAAAGLTGWFGLATWRTPRREGGCCSVASEQLGGDSRSGCVDDDGLRIALVEHYMASCYCGLCRHIRGRRCGMVESLESVKVLRRESKEARCWTGSTN